MGFENFVGNERDPEREQEMKAYGLNGGEQRLFAPLTNLQTA